MSVTAAVTVLWLQLWGFFFTGISQTDVMGCDQNFDVITSKHLYFSLTTLW